MFGPKCSLSLSLCVVSPLSLFPFHHLRCFLFVGQGAEEMTANDAEVIQWRRREATRRLKRLLQLDPQNERALFNLGMLAMDDGDMTAAEHNFKVSHLTDFFFVLPSL